MNGNTLRVGIIGFGFARTTFDIAWTSAISLGVSRRA